MTIDYYQYFQYFALLVAILCYGKLRYYSLQLMLPFMVGVCIIETIGINILYLGYKTNYPVYNCYVLLSGLIYFILFDKIIQWKKSWRQVYHIIAVMVMLFLIVDLAWIEKGQYISYSMTVLLIIHIMLGCMLLGDLAMEENREVKFMQEPYFWIAAGLILFSVGTVTMLGFHRYIRDHGLMAFGKPLYRVIVPMLNVVLYSCYSYAFYLCTKHEHKWQASSLP